MNHVPAPPPPPRPFTLLPPPPAAAVIPAVLCSQASITAGHLTVLASELHARADGGLKEFRAPALTVAHAADLLHQAAAVLAVDPAEPADAATTNDLASLIATLRAVHLQPPPVGAAELRINLGHVEQLCHAAAQVLAQQAVQHADLQADRAGMAALVTSLRNSQRDLERRLAGATLDRHQAERWAQWATVLATLAGLAFIAERWHLWPF